MLQSGQRNGWLAKIGFVKITVIIFTEMMDLVKQGNWKVRPVDDTGKSKSTDVHQTVPMAQQTGYETVKKSLCCARICQKQKQTVFRRSWDGLMESRLRHRHCRAGPPPPPHPGWSPSSQAGTPHLGQTRPSRVGITPSPPRRTP